MNTVTNTTGEPVTLGEAMAFFRWHSLNAPGMRCRSGVKFIHGWHLSMWRWGRR